MTRIEAIGWPHAPFVIPKEVYADWDAKAQGQAAETAWNASFAAYKAAHPALYDRAVNAGKDRADALNPTEGRADTDMGEANNGAPVEEEGPF